LQRALGTRVEIMAFGKSASAKLIEAADSFIDLDKDKKKYLMERRVVKKMPVQGDQEHGKRSE